MMIRSMVSSSILIRPKTTSLHQLQHHPHPQRPTNKPSGRRNRSAGSGDSTSDVSTGRGRATPPPGDVILVTGGDGFLGQHVVKQLHEHAPHVREIRVLDLRPFEPKLDYEARKPVTCHTGSVTDIDAVQHALRDVDSVIHIAGLVSYGTFPNVTAMEAVNVDGTLNVVRACLKANVSRLLYCSTVDVVVGFEPIRHGGEEDVAVARRFLFPGYPETKLKGERLVLEANGQRCEDGETTLHTLSLRANVMYGELDPFYVTTALRSARHTAGRLIQVGNGRALFQQCYAGNTAAAFVQADSTLRAKGASVGGLAFFVPDDTPLQNSFKFMEPFLEARGYSLTPIYLPYSLVYGIVYYTELVLKALSPLAKVHLETASCSIRYINTDLYFRRDKARSVLGFKPVYSPQEAKERSLAYYASMKL